MQRTTYGEVTRSHTPGDTGVHVVISDEDGTPPTQSVGHNVGEAIARAKLKRLIEHGQEDSPEAEKLREELGEQNRPDNPGRRRK